MKCIRINSIECYNCNGCADILTDCEKYYQEQDDLQPEYRDAYRLWECGNDEECEYCKWSYLSYEFREICCGNPSNPDNIKEN